MPVPMDNINRDDRLISCKLEILKNFYSPLEADVKYCIPLRIPRANCAAVNDCAENLLHTYQFKQLILAAQYI